jgi:uncharacterized RDD family membrane protein YckC
MRLGSSGCLNLVVGVQRMATDIPETLGEDEPYYTALSTVDTIRPRHLAAVMDNVLAMVLAVLAAKMIDGSRPILQAVVLVAVFLGYYLVFELLFSRTPGKFVTGLVIVQLDGTRCSWGQVLIRTVFRLLEVNPLLLGGLPAALSIIFSKHNQRLGDKVAESLVVYSRVLRNSR